MAINRKRTAPEDGGNKPNPLPSVATPLEEKLAAGEHKDIRFP